ncbi:MAG: histidine triad nucleotide-binding protein [Eubacteriales bacterium]|nr:histidine triad nucleotide-binding protein [Eubacteriales bacterium]
MNDCLFCKIIAGDIPSGRVYEDERIYAFKDINPQAPVHVLIVPKTHLSGLDGLEEAEDRLLASLLRAAHTIAAREGVETSGYRLISNCGPDACQSVKHLHFHLLGGKQLSEEMD